MPAMIAAIRIPDPVADIQFSTQGSTTVGGVTNTSRTVVSAASVQGYEFDSAIVAQALKELG